MRWRNPTTWSLAAAAVALLGAGTAQADFVRIISVNGEYTADHAAELSVKPGDVVQLSADVFSDDGSALNKFAENFVWTADDSATDQCNAAQGADCLGATNFEANDYGVSFYVPYDFAGSAITIQVTATDSYGTVDQIVLRNQLYVETPGYQPPTDVYTDPSQYQGSTLDPQVALAGQGNWVHIEGARYFRPHSYRNDWVPYQNGYWAWTGGADSDGDYDGWTWISYDPWGWMTDHYGHWRHHGTYGWIWRAFEGSRWRWHRHTVSWFHNGGEHLGWYPYYDGYADGYRHGRAQGFDDGFWLGYQAGRFYGSHGFVPGFTVIYGRDFGYSNCYDRRVGWDVTVGVWQRGFGSRYYGGHPGFGVTGIRESRGWLERGYRVSVPVTTIGGGRRFGGVELRYPVRVHATPAIDARPPYIAAGSLHRPYPVGAVFNGQAGTGRPVYTPPTADGRGIAHPPVIRQPGGISRPLPPMTGRPVTPNPGNPVYRPPVINPGLPPIVRPPVTRPPVVGRPPVTQPPVVRPPVTQPPVVRPPVTQPPVVRPPVVRPPVTQPPVVRPPVTQPPVVRPPVVRPPVTQPPVVRPPVTQPPVVRPPVVRPPVTQPPVVRPPVVRPPVTQPPVVRPPVTQPPVVRPPVTRPPVTQPPVVRPPVTRPPVTQPPVVRPPVTRPPVVQPPVSRPPVSQPPVSRPPVSRPPVSQPPVSRPPVVRPPVSQPPVVRPPSRPTPSQPSAPSRPSGPRPGRPGRPHA